MENSRSFSIRTDSAPRTVKTIFPAGVEVSSCQRRKRSRYRGCRRSQVLGADERRTGRSGRTSRPPIHQTGAVSVSHEAVEFRPIFFRAGDADIHVFPGYGPDATVGILSQFPELNLWVLAVTPIETLAYRAARFIGFPPSVLW
jgi:hypothetical protein